MNASPLTSAQRTRLKSLAHHLEPAVIVGKQGVGDSLINAAQASLAAHELIKIRFNDFKEEKKTLAPEIAARAEAHLVGIIGHIAILYKQHPDPEKRRIKL